MHLLRDTSFPRPVRDSCADPAAGFHITSGEGLEELQRRLALHFDCLVAAPCEEDVMQAARSRHTDAGAGGRKILITECTEWAELFDRAEFKRFHDHCAQISTFLVRSISFLFSFRPL